MGDAITNGPIGDPPNESEGVTNESAGVTNESADMTNEIMYAIP